LRTPTPSINPRFAPLLAAGLALLFPQCARDRSAADGAAPATDSPVLATVGGTAITANDLLAEAERRKERRQPVVEKDALLEAMVNRAALVHRARQSGLESDPEVRRALDNVLVSEFRQRELQGRLDAVEVSDEEMRATYAARSQSFTTPAKARLSILHLAAGEAASDGKREEARARMAEARTRALANPAPGGRGPAANGFGALAVEFSDDQVSRYRGGDAGWFVPGQAGARWPEDVLRAGHALAVGEVSEVLDVRGDYFLVRKTEESAAATTGYEDAAPAIRQQLLAAKREALEQAFHDENQRLAEVAFVPEALARVDLPAAPPVTEPKPPVLPGVSP